MSMLLTLVFLCFLDGSHQWATANLFSSLKGLMIAKPNPTTHPCAIFQTRWVKAGPLPHGAQVSNFLCDDAGSPFIGSDDIADSIDARINKLDFAISEITARISAEKSKLANLQKWDGEEEQMQIEEIRSEIQNLSDDLKIIYRRLDYLLQIKLASMNLQLENKKLQVAGKFFFCKGPV